MTSRLARFSAPVFYASASVALVGLVGRAFAAFEQPTPLTRLLDPRANWWLRGEPYVSLIVLGALVVATLRKHERWILLTFGACFVLTTFDVLWFVGETPKKVDFRLFYLLQSAGRLAWHAAFCALASLLLTWRSWRGAR